MKVKRNFWIELNCDGRKTKVVTGPIGSSGGFTLKICARHYGERAHIYSIYGKLDNKSLLVEIFDELSGVSIGRTRTIR